MRRFIARPGKGTKLSFAAPKLYGEQVVRIRLQIISPLMGTTIIDTEGSIKAGKLHFTLSDTDTRILNNLAPVYRYQVQVQTSTNREIEALLTGKLHIKNLA
jgi:hypothetical protein